MAHLTLGWLSLINASPLDVIGAAAGAGFRSASIRITGRTLGESFPDVVGDPAALRTLRRRISENGLRLSSVAAYHLSPEVTLQTMRPVFDAAAELGAEIILATCMDADHRRWTGFMQSYCEAAKDAGLTVALEFVPYSEARTIGVADRLIDDTGATNFGILVDSLHLARSGGTPADIAAVAPERIVFAQICDAAAIAPPADRLAEEAHLGRLYPGMGALPLADFLDALPDGTEIECEVPCVAHASLSPDEQAQRAAAAVRSYLADYADARGKPHWT